MKGFIVVHRGLAPSSLDFWNEDRELIRRSRNRQLLPYANLERPTEDELNSYLHSVNQVFGGFVQAASKPFNAESYLKGSEALISSVQNEWKAPLSRVTLVPAEEMLDFLNNRIHELNRFLPSRKREPKFKLPPGGRYDPYHDDVIMPDNYILIKAAPLSERSEFFVIHDTGKGELVHLPWQKEEFEVTLAEELNHSAFRRLRGETLEKYLETRRRADITVMKGTHVLNETLSEILNHSIFTTSEYSLSLLNSRSIYWMDRFQRSVYGSVRLLERFYPVSTIAMADLVTYSPPDSVVMYLDPRHPAYSEKRTKLEESAKGKAAATAEIPIEMIQRI